MIELVVGGIILGAAVLTAICVCVKHITQSTIKSAVKEKSRNATKAIIREIVKNPEVNHVKIAALDEYDTVIDEFDLSGDTVDDSIYRGQEILIDISDYSYGRSYLDSDEPNCHNLDEADFPDLDDVDFSDLDDVDFSDLDDVDFSDLDDVDFSDLDDAM